MNYEEVEALIAVLRDNSGLTELEVRNGERRLRLRRPPISPSARLPQSATAAVSTPGPNGAAVNALAGNGAAPYGESPAALPAVTLTAITAGLVGVFHAGRVSPLRAGDPVNDGQILGQIEAMRLMNDCKSTLSGTIYAVLVQDGQPVEYGQPLFEIEPA